MLSIYARTFMIATVAEAWEPGRGRRGDRPSRPAAGWLARAWRWLAEPAV